MYSTDSAFYSSTMTIVFVYLPFMDLHIVGLTNLLYLVKERNKICTIVNLAPQGSSRTSN